VANDVAVLDACVLYPAVLRDFFLSLAAADLFQPKWSDAIHEEWMNALLANRKDLGRRHLEAIRDQMNRYFLDSVVQGFESLIPTLTLPDPDDRHVLAAAICSSADAIITVNLRDFPPAALKPYTIVAVEPDVFANYLLDLDQNESIAALAKMRGRLKAPAMTPTEFVDSIERAGLLTAAARLRHYATRL
jgi:predicted nucleic acid-binding protein